MQTHDLVPLVEALLFAADAPLTINALVKTVGDESVTSTDVRSALDSLMEGYDAHPRGIHLIRLGNGYQLLTREEFAPWVESMVTGKKKARLSRAALETAAVIGYKQPLARGEIERIRGVDVGAVLQTLMERNLIMIKGRDPGPGRALLYGTTQEYLEYFGLAKITDLPHLDEIAALARAEGSPIWDDAERNRFAKHGVEPDSVPPPGSDPGDVVIEDVEDVATETGEEPASPGDDAAAERDPDRGSAEPSVGEAAAESPSGP